mgnify:CR=1 FL=1
MNGKIFLLASDLMFETHETKLGEDIELGSHP